MGIQLKEPLLTKIEMDKANAVSRTRNKRNISDPLSMDDDLNSGNKNHTSTRGP